MTTLPERLQDVIVEFRRIAKDHEIRADRPHQDDATRQWHMGTSEAYDDAADRLEAAQPLQALEVKCEARFNDDGTLDEIVGFGTFHLEQMDTGHWWMQLGPHMVGLHARGKITANFGANEAYAAPSPTAALQAGVGRFVACRCVSERDRELCMTKDECSKVYAYSDTAPKEPTK